MNGEVDEDDTMRIILLLLSTFKHSNNMQPTNLSYIAMTALVQSAPYPPGLHRFFLDLSGKSTGCVYFRPI
jgi:hypothetical protein